MKNLLIGALALVGAAAIDLSDIYPAYNFSVPVDHFHNESRYEPHSNESYNLRYWFDASNYKPGGPVIVLQSGETSGVGRLPFLEKGKAFAPRSMLTTSCRRECFSSHGKGIIHLVGAMLTVPQASSRS
jgi:hypothetical protein